jgi:hypothetical protein
MLELATSLHGGWPEAGIVPETRLSLPEASNRGSLGAYPEGRLCAAPVRQARFLGLESGFKATQNRSLSLRPEFGPGLWRLS